MAEEADTERLHLVLTRAELRMVLNALVPAGDQQALLSPSLFSRAVPAEELDRVLSGAMHALRSYQFGNAAPDLAEGIADALQVLLGRLGHADGAGVTHDMSKTVAGLQALQSALAIAGFGPIRRSK